MAIHPIFEPVIAAARGQAEAYAAQGETDRLRALNADLLAAARRAQEEFEAMRRLLGGKTWAQFEAAAQQVDAAIARATGKEG